MEKAQVAYHQFFYISNLWEHYSFDKTPQQPEKEQRKIFIKFLWPEVEQRKRVPKIVPYQPKKNGELFKTAQITREPIE
jgi:hypothetical protein